ncbi:hypothetical protein [Dyella sp. C9]|uniref:hypothetical protein n=1 Tax=Dyella sp. C9 TaxID=2202154 RepID=UPI000DEF771D|nr:hypothetical protein [Dyella sp. C9]
MSSVIEFLERLGADAQLRHASAEELTKALEESQIDSALGAAIIAHSTSADELYSLLGLRPMFHTMENPGREDEDEEGEGEDEGEEEKDALADFSVSALVTTRTL